MAGKGRGRRVALVVLALVVAAAVAAGAVLYHAVAASVGRIQTYAQIASSAGGALSGDVADLNTAALDADARTVSEQAQAISRELDGWQWDVAGRIPPFTGDVELARTLAQVGTDLSDQALTPVAGLLRQARQQLESGSVSGVVDAAGTLRELADAVDDARGVVDGCRSRLDGAPQPGIDGLVQARSTVEGILDQADDALDQVQPAVDAVQTAGDVSDAALSAAEKVSGGLADALSGLLGAGGDSADSDGAAS